MLSIAQDHLRHLNPHASLEAYGQELNAESYAICRSDLMLKGQDAGHITLGNSFAEDSFKDRQGSDKTFDYLLANPPFGVEWKKVEKTVRDEHDKKGFGGRFGAGLPRINDGSFLFLQHMIKHMKPVEQGGSRLAIVFNGSPLFTGAAGSGESEIRRWIIESDWLEAVVALPDQLFYNTGISTYFWVVTNRKAPERRGLVQLVDARGFWQKMRKSLGDKRKELSAEHISQIVKLYAGFTEGEHVKILPNSAFGFLRVTVERPLRLRWEITEDTLEAVQTDRTLNKLDPAVLETLIGKLRGSIGLSSVVKKDLTQAVAAAAFAAGGLKPPRMKALWNALSVRDPDAPIVTDTDGNPEPDPELRDQENVPLPEGVANRYEQNVTDRLAGPVYVDAVEQHLEREVHPYVPDAWIDHSKTRIGYEIPVTRHFYKYVPPRLLAEIDAEIKHLESEIQGLLRQVTE